MKRQLSPLAILLCALLAVALPGRAQEPASAADPAVVLRSLAASRLDPGRAVSLKKVKLNVGLATLHLEDGILVPAIAEGLSPVELVFLGQGRIEMAAPDEVEAGQLELFTGSPRLDETFRDAVLVIGPDAAVAALLRKPAAPPDEAARQRAEALWTEWRKKREREIFDVDRGILLDALKDPLGGGYFAAWFRGGPHGDFLYRVEPDEQEQVQVGRFVPLDATEKEKREIEKEIRRQQQKGRAQGLEVDDLGDWDTWVAAALRNAAGEPVHGTPAFEPAKYTLDVRLSQPNLRLTGKVRIDLERVVRGSRVVGLSLSRDFTVSRVTDGEGKELFYHRGDEGLTVILPAPPADGEAVAVVVDYAGNPIEKSWNLMSLLGTESWYPRAGLVDRATYEATFHWPKGFDLMAGGRRTDGGDEADGTRWERRVLDHVALGYSFEVGHFDVETAKAGHVQVTYAFDSGTTLTGRGGKDEVKRTVADALTFFEEVFGPYPLDEMTVATAPRGFSQGFLGFVTISDVYLAGDLGIWNRLYGVTDRRLVIAHEVAHQWWGNQVGWTSYRDQWISEAMASYAAALYAKERLKNELAGVDLTDRWREDLVAQVANGRSVESLGPVVLGSRLSSSLSGAAYVSIVYQKGAVILEMLARLLGEENFPRILRQVVKASAGRNISTEDLFSMIETVSSTELDDFAGQFVYRTGLPEAFYTYRFEKSGSGWTVKGQARQSAPYRFHYKMMRTDRGTWDVRRDDPAPQFDVQRSRLVVPVEIEVYDPGQRKGEGVDGANQTVRGHILLAGESTDFAIEIEAEPKAFRLDPKAQVCGLFYDEGRSPKLSLFSRALKAAAEGRTGEAEKLFAQALEVEDPAPVAEKGATVYWQDLQWMRRLFNARIESSRALLLMDLNRDDEAEAAISRARRVVRDDFPLDRVQARLEVRRGRYDKAYQLLRRGDRWDVLDVQGYALLAIAARETGHAEEHEEALRKARQNGVDVSLLAAGTPASP